MIKLFENEIEIEKLVLGLNTLILTSKRLIFNDKFIAIQELRVAETKAADYTYRTTNIKNEGVLFMSVGAIIAVVFTIYLVYKEDGTQFAHYASALLIGGFIILPTALIITAIILSIFVKSTSKKMTRTNLIVVDTGNRQFLNEDYDIAELESIRNFSDRINSLIYK